MFDSLEPGIGLLFLFPLAAIVLEMVLPLGWSWHPLQGLQIFAQRLSDKVNRPDNGPRQQRIAGGAGLFVCVALPWTCLWVLQELVLEPELYHAVLLYFLISARPTLNSVHQISQQLPDHRQARLTLGPLLLRDTSKLTEVGVVKASLEMLILRCAYGWFVPLFWFAVLGIWAALAYSLVYCVQQQWNTKHLQYQQFGKAAMWSQRTLAWPVLQVIALLGCIYGSFRQNLRALKTGFRWPYPASGQLLALQASWLNCEIGGPRFYDSTRHDFAKFGPLGVTPTAKQLSFFSLRLQLLGLTYLVLMGTIYGMRIALL
ncbi:hypothetical protein DBZ36_15730 [Alginatibacterium sediminis]|uniref:Cobalamin biosynthesis protein CbiB n=1 Tax=Alginatibacterium sediminis TaxID=2164068 RepID=A0A420E916_9ALTE|nr:cobalamin biosynthesis protein [Alginatibacterium sediminis]RKF15823.1 hypothetical protein DBZ36_15730 [Alginatibacterium sediminis]